MTQVATGEQPADSTVARTLNMQRPVVQDRDWLDTVRQVVPAGLMVLRHLKPTWEMPGLSAIDDDFLERSALRGIIWDVDGTLTHRHACRPTPTAADAIERLLRLDGLRHVILSNCGELRFEQLGEIFPSVPVVKGYAGGGGLVFRVRRGNADHWFGSPTQLLRPLRKPDPRLVRFALEVLGITEPHTVAMIGDQYLTDVAAANLAGIRSIKLPTEGAASFPPAVRLLQTVDRWLGRLTS